MTGVVKRGGDDQDRGIDEQCQKQRNGAVERRPADGVAASVLGPLEGARLHDRGMQIEIVRHHGRADDADRHIEHVAVRHDRGRRQEAGKDRSDGRCRRHDLNHETDRDHDEQRDNEGLENRNPRFIIANSRNTSNAVISAPITIGTLNSSCNAIAVPITSARSQATIATSQPAKERD